MNLIGELMDMNFIGEQMGMNHWWTDGHEPHWWTDGHEPLWQRPHTITKMNNNINMDSTIVRSVNAHS
jgi:hypothetical protein